jgi:hypothetical protein
MSGRLNAPNASDDEDAVTLFEEPFFTFRFADDRIIPRFHLEGVGAGRRVSVYRFDPGTGERSGLLATPPSASNRRTSGAVNFGESISQLPPGCRTR